MGPPSAPRSGAGAGAVLQFRPAAQWTPYAGLGFPLLADGINDRHGDRRAPHRAGARHAWPGDPASL